MFPSHVQEYLDENIFEEATKGVNEFFKNGIFTYEDVENLYDDEDEDMKYKEIQDWWLISEELYQTCKRLKYPVIKKHGFKFWGEETNNTGHAHFFFQYPKYEVKL